MLSEMVMWAVARGPSEGKLELKVKEDLSERFAFAICLFYTNTLLITRDMTTHALERYQRKMELDRKEEDVFFFNDPIEAEKVMMD